jgi:hypothetical protein
MRLVQNGWDASSENHKQQQNRSIGNYLKVGSLGKQLKKIIFQQNIQFPEFKPKRVVIVSKSSLLEYEFEKPKKQYKDFDDQRFTRDVCQKSMVTQQHKMNFGFCFIVEKEICKYR